MQALADYIRVYDDDLTPDFCARLVGGFEQTRALQVRNGRGMRAGLEESAWTELDVGQLADDAFRGFFLAGIERALARYNADVALRIPVPMRPRTDRLILKRYRPGGDEAFQPHFDSIDEVCGRYLVFLWYLNDVAEGGETEFCDLGIKVAPRTGRLLVFPPYWMFQHAGRPPASGDKYILSTYLMF
jgi:prolyl 4-hydroxylase